MSVSFVTPWTVAHIDRLLCLYGFSRQDYWSGLPFPTQGDLLDPGKEILSFVSPGMAGGFFTKAPSGTPMHSILHDILEKIKQLPKARHGER